ncbi:uncharacterized protein N7511_003754 [Penicillium nucicola]|uniref:uncharacterized protein n=1 Tax=Penicillium nucicola TaxID=1850975 RepID=UPI00254543A0|nr:uncharacterized protein N7511_003754 [Penicillium nucicola]KAJ5766138.1 hypothetical protein N7511_003754 [Penicillium nucicola]
MQNPSCLLYGPGDARFEDQPMPTINDPLDVIIRIEYVGVCGSDVHFWVHGGIGNHVSATNPIVMGHEASGTVHAIGSSVKNLQLGDAVAIEPGFGCRICSKCKSGKYNLCPNMRFAANPLDTHGALSKFFKVPADCCYKISGSLDSEFGSEFPHAIGLDEAVLIEPMAVAMHSVRQVGVKPGDRVIVFGAGTVGILCAAVAREFGANLIVSVDLSDDKLEFAKKFVGEDRVRYRTAIPAAQLDAEENAVGLRSWLSGVDPDADVPGFDVAIEATGAEPCIQTAIHVLKVGGSFVQTGLGNRNVKFPISTVSENEITVKGCFRYGAGDFQMALELAKSRKIELKSLITKVVPFENVVEAWETTQRGEGIKTLIRGVGRAV